MTHLQPEQDDATLEQNEGVNAGSAETLTGSYPDDDTEPETDADRYGPDSGQDAGSME